MQQLRGVRAPSQPPQPSHSLSSTTLCPCKCGQETEKESGLQELERRGVDLGWVGHAARQE